MKTDKLPEYLRDLLLAFVLLTRLPLPRVPEDDFAQAARAVWAYPIVGVTIAAVATSIGTIGLAAGLPAPLAAGLVLGALMLSTGALHEDGLADVADGFWGAFTAEQRLTIMKDSQIGTYGTLALIVVTGLRWTAIATLLVVTPVAILCSAALSRTMMPLLMRTLPPARDNGLSLSVGRPEWTPVLAGLALALLFSVVWMAFGALLALGSAMLVTLMMSALAKAKIKGQTGDVLGAMQQLSETAVLCVLSAYFS
jgi:adenosylcobinamide-GDP ribazoletransferase